MARQPRPRWNNARRRWYANVGDAGKDGKARAVFAPAGLGQRDEAGAWDWFRVEVAGRAAATDQAAEADGSAQGVCENYLAWAEQRRDDGRLSAEHFTNKQYHLGHFCEALGRRNAASLVPEDMTRFVGLASARFSPNYVSSICSTVAAAFNWSVKSRRLTVNPIAGHESPVVPRSAERFAERAEAAAFLRFWRSRLDRASVAGRFDRSTLLLERVLIRTGARPGELCKLWWADLRWEGGVTSVGHSFARAVIPPERWKSGAKTGKSRTLYFSPLLSRALRRVHDRPGRHPVSVFVHGRGRGGKGAGEPWESGSRLSKKILHVRREAIERAGQLRAAGLPTRGLELIRDDGPNRLVNYRWRHTAISTLLMMGVDVPTVAELTGTSPQMIYSVYGHLLDSHLSAAAEKLGTGRRR